MTDLFQALKGKYGICTIFHKVYSFLHRRGVKYIQRLGNKNTVVYFLSHYFRAVTGSTPAQDSHGERRLYRLLTSVHFLGKKNELTKTYHYNWYCPGRRPGTDWKVD